MPFRIPPRAFKSSSFRLSVWYSGFFISCSVLILVMTHYFLSSALLRADKTAIVSELGRLTTEYNFRGLPSLQRELAENKNMYRGKNPFFVRIADISNRPLFILNPEVWEEFDLSLLASHPLHNGQWTKLASADEKAELLLFSRRLHDGRWLQLGRSSEVREQALGQFFRLFFIIIPPLVILGVAGGTFLAARTMRPIQHMIHTVQSIVNGNYEARVPYTESRDELNELAKLFNEMVDRIHTLITGMKESIDNLGHELRTPMTRLRNTCEMALQRGKNVDSCREALADCLEESDRILKMLNTLMDISEAETGVMKLHPKSIPFLRLLTPLVDMYQYIAEEKDVVLAIHAPEELYLTVDPNRMTQVLANILDNAIKYTPAGGRVTVDAKQSDGRSIIAIADSGIGISPKDLPKIWDRLYRGDGSRSTKGLGLGLSFVKAIVQAHQGTIDVASTPGIGSTFIISLPSNPRLASRHFNPIITEM